MKRIHSTQRKRRRLQHSRYYNNNNNEDQRTHVITASASLVNGTTKAASIAAAASLTAHDAASISSVVAPRSLSSSSSSSSSSSNSVSISTRADNENDKFRRLQQYQHSSAAVTSASMSSGAVDASGRIRSITTASGGSVKREVLSPKHNAIPGLCDRGKCGPEAACIQLNETSYACVCPHDLSQPTADFKCPNRATVPLAPQPIHNIIPPSVVNITTPVNNASVDQERTADLKSNWMFPSDDYVTIGSTCGSIVVLLIIFTLLFWWKRRYFGCFGSNNRSRKSSCSAASPMNLKKSLLVAERYTPNPQYSACTSPCVPILTRDCLKFHHEIGEGCFGKVFKGELIREATSETNAIAQTETVAIKVLKETASLEAEEDFMREVEIMSTFRHKNILTLIGVVLREGGMSPWMVFEFMPHGDLAEVLRSNSKSPLWQPQPHAGLPTELTRTHLLSAAYQIASGMRYLAAQRFVHRDLACRNCLVGSGLTVKIADFGMSRDVYTCDYYKIGGSRLLPVRWMSPESVMYGRFTLESDVWSYGVVLWEIFSYGKQPYYGHSNEEVVKLILQGIMLIPPEDCPSEICDIMRCCWKTEPRDRIRFSEIYDRLEQTFEQYSKPSQQTLNVQAENCRDNKNNHNSFMDTTGFSTFKKARTCSSVNSTLPRPPPVPVTPNFDLLDREGYLIPQPCSTVSEYMQTLPD